MLESGPHEIKHWTIDCGNRGFLQVFDIRGRYGTYGKVDSMTVTLDKTVEEGGRKYKYVDFKFTVGLSTSLPLEYYIGYH